MFFAEEFQSSRVYVSFRLQGLGSSKRFIRNRKIGLPERAQLWSEDWADRERAAAFVSEARRFHDESAARLAAAINELRSNASLSEEGGSPTSQDAPTPVAPAADEVVEIEAARAPPTCCVVCCVC